MTKRESPTGEREAISLFKISGKIGGGHNSPLIKVYKDYENTHLASRETTFSLESWEIENVLAKKEVKEKLSDEKFKKYLLSIIKNSLTKAAEVNDGTYSKLRKNLIHLMAVTESNCLRDLLRNTLSTIDN